MLGELELRVERYGLPPLVIAVDDSQSMLISDPYRDSTVRQRLEQLVKQCGWDEPTRLNIAKAVLASREAQMLKRLSKSYRLVLYAVSSGVRHLGEFDASRVEEAAARMRSLEPAGTETRLGSALRRLLDELGGTPPAGLILLTDGRTTSGPSVVEAAREAAGRSVPIYAVGIGSPLPARDLALHDLLVEDVVFAGDIVTFEAKLSAKGVTEGEALVHLKRAGQQRPVMSKLVKLPRDGKDVTVRLFDRPTDTGDIRYVLEVEPIEHELQRDNNRLERVVSVRDQKLRVLLVDSFPRFEFRFLKHLLEREKTVDLNVLLLEADPGYPEQDRVAIAHFPTSRDELWKYDVIILGDVNPAYFNEAQLVNVREFVLERGGGLVLIAGQRYMPAMFARSPLGPVIPVVLTGAQAGGPVREAFRPALTAEGRSHPIIQIGSSMSESLQIWRRLPGGYWYFRSPRAKPGSLVLAVHPTERADGRRLPLIVLQRAGAGRSLFLAFDFTWRWREPAGELYYNRFWLQTLRYLSKAALLGTKAAAELTTDKEVYHQGQPVELRLRVLDAGLVGTEQREVVVQVERGAGWQRRVTLRRSEASSLLFRGALSGLLPGRYRAWLLSPSPGGRPPAAAFVVEAAPLEFQRVEADLDSLRAAAQLTGGKFYSPLQAYTLPRDIPPGRKIPLQTEPPIRLWHSWPLLILFVSLLIFEWSMRKYLRML